eukprot:302763-Amphidinium_carterae.1
METQLKREGFEGDGKASLQCHVFASIHTFYQYCLCGHVGANASLQCQEFAFSGSSLQDRLSGHVVANAPIGV